MEKYSHKKWRKWVQSVAGRKLYQEKKSCWNCTGKYEILFHSLQNLHSSGHGFWTKKLFGTQKWPLKLMCPYQFI